MPPLGHRWRYRKEGSQTKLNRIKPVHKNDGFEDKLDGRSQTLRAVRRNDLAWLQRIVSKNANMLEIKGHMGRRPLHVAVEEGFGDIVQFLIDAGAEVNGLRDRKDTPLFWAPNVQIAQLLLAAGAKLDARDFCGRQPIHWAAQFGRTEVIRLFLERGCDSNVLDDDGCTPLHWATGSIGTSFIHISQITNTSFLECVNLLLRNGSNVNARNAAGLVPLHAVSFIPDPSQRLLTGELKYPVGIDSTIMAIVRTLIKYGADPNVRSNDGISPMDMADDHVRPIMQEIR